uniref:Uncharacterized protein n=1 Tax=Prolemur simus TaxID=1328070 RepID=A0A8C8ZLC8_PROSS
MCCILCSFVDRCHLFPSRPPSSSYILVAGSRPGAAHCGVWRCAGNWVSSSSPPALLLNSPSVVGNRFSTSSRPPG